MDRVIGLIDMDCFYVQVEQRADPSLAGLPCAVVQYRTYKGGGIIAVNYEARHLGVTRGMMGDEAKAKCPVIHLVRVPESRGKANLTKYREAGAEVIETLMSMNLKCCIERASIDEAYIDLTAEVDKRLNNDYKVTIDLLPNTVIAEYHGDGEGGVIEDSLDLAESEKPPSQILTKLWLENRRDKYNVKLAVGACIIEEMRAEIFKVTRFKCSAGISHNKVLAKLACGLNKPNKQTLLSNEAVQAVFVKTKLHKVRNLGGKLGQSLKDDLGVEVMSDLCQFSESLLSSKYGHKNGSWLYNMCRGIEHEPVQARQLPQSIGCSKNFNGKEQLDTRDKVMLWLKQLSEEVVERLKKDLEANKRLAKTLTVSLSHQAYPVPQSSTRSCPLPQYDVHHIANCAYNMISKFNTNYNCSNYTSTNSSNCSDSVVAWLPPIVNLGVTASKFVALSDSSDHPTTTNLKRFIESFSPAAQRRLSGRVVSCDNNGSDRGETFQKQLVRMVDDDDADDRNEVDDGGRGGGGVESWDDAAAAANYNNGHDVIDRESFFKSEVDGTKRECCNDTSISRKHNIMIPGVFSRMRDRAREKRQQQQQMNECDQRRQQQQQSLTEEESLIEARQEEVQQHSGQDDNSVKRKLIEKWLERSFVSNCDSSNVNSQTSDSAFIKFSDRNNTKNMNDGDVIDNYNDSATTNVDDDDEENVVNIHNVVESHLASYSKIRDELEEKNLAVVAPYNNENNIKDNKGHNDIKDYNSQKDNNSSQGIKDTNNSNNKRIIVDLTVKKLQQKPKTALDEFLFQRLNSPKQQQQQQQQNDVNISSQHYQNADYITCDKCGHVISAWDFPEHEDYHYACQLQRQQNQQQRQENQQRNQQQRQQNQPEKQQPHPKPPQIINPIDKYIKEFCNKDKNIGNNNNNNNNNSKNNNTTFTTSTSSSSPSSFLSPGRNSNNNNNSKRKMVGTNLGSKKKPIGSGRSREDSRTTTLLDLYVGRKP